MPRGALTDKDAEVVRCHLHDHRSGLVSAHGVIQVLRASASRIVDKLIQDLFTRKEPNTSYQRWSKGKVRHLAVGDFWVQHHTRSGKIRVSKCHGWRIRAMHKPNILGRNHCCATRKLVIGSLSLMMTSRDECRWVVLW